VSLREPVSDLAAVAVEIADIRSLAPDALRRRWRAEFGRKPPPLDHPFQKSGNGDD
jgi:hypothetical protein